MKDITRDIPITLILPGAGITMTVLTIPIINPLSKENTGLILPDDASTMTASSAKLIGTEGIEQEFARYGIGMGLVVILLSPYKRGPARRR